jgi:hypothetical protein
LGSKSRWAHLFPERKKKQEQLWQGIGKLLRRYEQEGNPASWKIFVNREGWYLWIRFALLCALFYLMSSEFNVWNIFILLIAAFSLVDILAANTSASFVTMQPIDNLRSFILTFFAFTHIIVAFAIFYKYNQEQFAFKMCTTQLLYFSAVTITTLGDGTFLPNRTGTAVQVLIIVELLIGLFFITGVFARIINLDIKTKKNENRKDKTTNS